MSSILQPWVETLGLRHQGVLVSAMRGCDNAIRHDHSKKFQRIMRSAVLIPHCGRTGNPMTYITPEPDNGKWEEAVYAFSASWDHFPNHYVVHSIHAAEIIGYHGPNEFPVFSRRWRDWYLSAVNILHMNPEGKDQLDARLNADEEKFHELQEAYRR